MIYRIYKTANMGPKELGKKEEIKEVVQLIDEDIKKEPSGTYMVIEHNPEEKSDNIYRMIANVQDLEVWHQEIAEQEKTRQR